MEPRRVAQLHRPPQVAGEAAGLGEELVEPFGVALPAGRQLHQRRPQRRAEAAGPVEVVGQPRGGVAQLHAVRPELAELEGVEETGRGLGPPRLHRLDRRQPVERRVELHRVEQCRVVAEPLPGGQPLGVHRPPPVAIQPPGAAHPGAARHKRVSTSFGGEAVRRTA